MPRPKKEGAPEPKKRSRHGCWNCKARKIKCGEEKPLCLNCERQNEKCDYSIRLNWDGRTKKTADQGAAWSTDNFVIHPGADASPQSHFTPASISPDRSDNASPFLHPASARLSQHQQSRLARPQSETVSTGIQSEPRGGQEISLNINVFHIGPQQDARQMAGIGSAQTWQSSTVTPIPMPRIMDYRSTIGANHESKRMKFSPSSEGLPSFSHDYFQDSRTYQAQSLSTSLPSPRSMYRGIPASPITPGLSVASDESQARLQAPSPSFLEVRRVSVKSLLQSPSDEEAYRYTPLARTPGQTGVYGFDQGRPDLDIPRNDDTNALTLLSPTTTHKELQLQDYFTEADDASRTGFGFGLHGKDPKFQRGEYYMEPVPVKIPPSLEPLPALLLDNPMNLLYFHHFMNHTARMLVPHDCPENPFRSVLPQMAIGNSNLLNLLLAYSASHRARLLNHRDPVNRIAHLVRDVFPRLRHDLDDARQHISDANLATAIMLASLEIMSPNAFEVPVSWQNHLTIARQIIIARGGYPSLPRKDKVAHFLSRWFAYLDVMGSLSGSNYDRPLSYDYLGDGETEAESESAIDCVLGFTSRCVTILVKIAHLGKQCDSQRIGLGGAVRDDWEPSEDIIDAAAKLKRQLQAARPTSFRGCPHRDCDATGAESFEMSAVNDTFHWAGLIHLYRRVLGKRTGDEEVQIAVREIISALDRIRKGGTAEASIVFPMFTAGCEALEAGQRAQILDRIKTVEPYGMAQVHRARTLMQKVWDTGKPWEMLVSGEFFG